MTLLALFGLLPALFSLAGEAREQPAVRRIVVHDEVILRIPVRPRMPRRVQWVAHKGPKCIAANRIAAATLSSPSSIDFVMHNRRRIRAEMDDRCPALDFYDGFYFQLSDDRICAKREMIRSRVGASCRIQRFRTLVPQIRK